MYEGIGSNSKRAAHARFEPSRSLPQGVGFQQILAPFHKGPLLKGGLEGAALFVCQRIVKDSFSIRKRVTMLNGRH